MTINFSIKAAQWHTDETAIREVRTAVFIGEQQVPEALEWDGLDEYCDHWVALKDNKVIGTCRMQNDGHVGRMAVLKQYRGNGIGQALLSAAIDKAKSNTLYEIYLYAQIQAVPLYQKSGFVVYGEEFQDAGIPHLAMRLQLSERRLLGQHPGNFAVKDLKHTALELIQQTTKQLRILSYSLDHHLFDNAEMRDAISTLARSSRYTEVRILVIDPTLMVKKGHQLLTLQRRLPSNILLRRSTAHPHDIKENLIIADQIGLINQSIREPEKIWANFNNRPVAENHSALFDGFWEHGVIDKDLRQLDL